MSPTSGPARERHLFICGLHRSGTSPLHRLLREQQGVSGFEDTDAIQDEGQHLQRAVPPGVSFGGTGRFAFDPRSALTDGDATEDVAAQLRDDWAAHWAPGAEWYLEKSPPNIVRSRFLQAVYPDASFAFVTRHPVAVALATWKWNRDMHLETLLRHWLIAHEQARRDVEHLDRVTWLTFEGFVREPGDAVRRCLEMPADAPVTMNEPIREGANDEYFARWRRLCNRLPTSRWMLRIIGRLESEVRDFGYSLIDLDAVPASPELLR